MRERDPDAALSWLARCDIRGSKGSWRDERLGGNISDEGGNAGNGGTSRMSGSAWRFPVDLTDRKPGYKEGRESVERCSVLALEVGNGRENA